MLEEATKRLNKASDSVYESDSLVRTKLNEDGVSIEQELLIATIILGIVVVVLILIIIIGYFKYVKGKKSTMEGQTIKKDIEQPQVVVSQVEGPSEAPPAFVPVKMRKRSMTFSETDEECRKYREDLADSYDKPEEVEKRNRSRKKSTVTFVGVEEFEANA